MTRYLLEEKLAIYLFLQGLLGTLNSVVLVWLGVAAGRILLVHLSWQVKSYITHTNTYIQIEITYSLGITSVFHHSIATLFFFISSKLLSFWIHGIFTCYIATSNYVLRFRQVLCRYSSGSVNPHFSNILLFLHYFMHSITPCCYAVRNDGKM